jgi:outer membrane protein OmpA-like peptidoglycan-associated protein
LARFVLFCTILWIPGRAQPEALPDTQAVAVPATARAINYRNLTGSTEIGLRGTILMSQALGGAKVQNRGGAMSVKAWFKGMEPATKFGPEYLTYVLWAVTPVGRPVNLGEVIVRKSGRAKLEARTNLQTFGLIVTAEPHFAVSRVSSLVVLENAVTGATRGQVEEAEVRYERLPRSAYGQPGTPVASVPDRKISPYVRQAVNAFAIARLEGAEHYAPVEFQKAAALMAELEADPKKWKKPAIALARQLAQQAEDARMVAVQTREQARQREAVEQAQREAEAARAESERTRSQAETARLEAERARQQASLETQKAREQAAREVSAEVLAVRKRLKDQLSRLLETRETERGVEVSLSDLLFPSGKAALQPATREKLAKVAGIILAYPGVQVSVLGHTDATGSAALNQRLSLRRAQLVRDYLVRQGLPLGAVTAQGFGSDWPVASNDAPSGRQQNRRVELIITGGAIGF